MDIRLGKSYRIRLSRQEFDLLKSGATVYENFELCPTLAFKVEISMSHAAQQSSLKFTENSLGFFISDSDFDILVSDKNKKSGVAVENYFIQVDLWDENIRARNLC